MQKQNKTTKIAEMQNTFFLFVDSKGLKKQTTNNNKNRDCAEDQAQGFVYTKCMLYQ